MKTPIEMMMDGVEWKQREGTVPDSDDGLPYATHEGVLHIGEAALKCYRLSDSRAVFDAEDVRRFFGFEE